MSDKLLLSKWDSMFGSEAFALSSAVCIPLSSMFINDLNGRVRLLLLARWQITADLRSPHQARATALAHFMTN